MRIIATVGGAETTTGVTAATEKLSVVEHDTAIQTSHLAPREDTAGKETVWSEGKFAGVALGVLLVLVLLVAAGMRWASRKRSRDVEARAGRLTDGRKGSAYGSRHEQLDIMRDSGGIVVSHALQEEQHALPRSFPSSSSANAWNAAASYSAREEANISGVAQWWSPQAPAPNQHEIGRRAFKTHPTDLGSDSHANASPAFPTGDIESPGSVPRSHEGAASSDSVPPILQLTMPASGGERYSIFSHRSRPSTSNSADDGYHTDDTNFSTLPPSYRLRFSAPDLVDHPLPDITVHFPAQHYEATPEPTAPPSAYAQPGKRRRRNPNGPRTKNTLAHLRSDQLSLVPERHDSKAQANVPRDPRITTYREGHASQGQHLKKSVDGGVRLAGGPLRVYTQPPPVQGIGPSWNGDDTGSSISLPSYHTHL